ncbi:recombinase family protein [Streptomyces sp. NBC_00124]|uniref:recombinase family protein n=1 Tax=Streptomyces sp. NBC_00124 TaxID=2975662 RepID=UPI00224F8433|nr:recombinase family protein [Streptomyces sp. NBC_00124]MCX5362918.1 recombinase family protein [Streptomyces sp. NBC_00124]
MTTPLSTTFHGSPDDMDGEPWLGYIRVSTWKEEKISPELQETALRAWAARTGRRLLEPFIIDLDATGRNFRRKIMSGIKRVEDGEARGIAVWKYSRFGRTRDGVAVNLKRLEDAGGQLQSATEEGDARTATGRLQRGILFEFAAYESDVRGEQWKETHDHRRYKLHLPATGRPRFGYVWHPRRLPDPQRPGQFILQEERYVADEIEGPVMADRYRQYIDGDPFYSLVGELNSAGYRTTRGGVWSEQTLIRYMDSGFSAGLLRVHNPACRCASEVRGNCPNTLFIPGAQEELISAELWQMYQERREKVRATPPRARRAVYELAGLLRHTACRGGLAANGAQRVVDGQTVNVPGVWYRCGKRTVSGPVGCEGIWIKRDHVEREVAEWLEREAAGDIDAAPSIPHQRTAPRDERAEAARERARLQADADKLAKALVNLRTDRAMNPDDYGPGEYEAARDRIRAQQAANTAAMERVAVVESTPHRADYEPLIVGLVAEWRTLEPRERNAILKQLVRRVAVRSTDDGPKVEIHPVWEPDPWESATVAA